MKPPLTIAVQKSGKLTKPSLEYLASRGLGNFSSLGQLTGDCLSTGNRVLFVRDDDIPAYVAAGVADIGIVGQNVLEEKDSEVNTLDYLGFGNCRLVVAVPLGSGIKQLGDLRGERIATSYPKILSSYLESKGINASVLEISGSVEIAPAIGLADAICDLVDTGNTLREHELEVLSEVTRSEAVLIANNNSKLTYSFMDKK